MQTSGQATPGHDRDAAQALTDALGWDWTNDDEPTIKTPREAVEDVLRQLEAAGWRIVGSSVAEVRAGRLLAEAVRRLVSDRLRELRLVYDDVAMGLTLTLATGHGSTAPAYSRAPMTLQALTDPELLLRVLERLSEELDGLSVREPLDPRRLP